MKIDLSEIDCMWRSVRYSSFLGLCCGGAEHAGSIATVMPLRNWCRQIILSRPWSLLAHVFCLSDSVGKLWIKSFGKMKTEESRQYWHTTE